MHQGLKCVAELPTSVQAPSGNGANHQFASIQALRAIAAILVVVYHATLLWHERLPTSPDPTWEQGNSGVDLFFVISGCVMLLSSQRLRRAADGWSIFALRRVIRLVPMYWLVTVAKLISVVTAPALIFHSRPTLWNTVASFLFLPSRNASGVIVPVLPVGWTLTFEMLFYAVFSVALLLAVEPLLLITPAMLALAALAATRTTNSPAVTAFANPLVLEFVFGLALAHWHLRRQAGPPRLGFVSVVAVLGFACLLLANPLAVADPLNPWQRAVVWGGGATAVVYAALVAERSIAARLPRLLVRLGEASYSLYLTHGFVLPVLAVVLIQLHLASVWFGVALTISSVVFSSALALIVYQTVEHPLTLWLQRVLAAPSSRVVATSATAPARLTVVQVASSAARREL